MRSVKIFIINLLIVYTDTPVPYCIGCICRFGISFGYFFESPCALLDSCYSGIKDEGNVSYGNIRVWGAVGFAINVYICGKMIDKFSTTNVLFPFLFAMGCLAAFACTRIKIDRPAAAENAGRLNLKKLFNNRQYIYFLIFAIILTIPHRSAFTFLPNLMKSVGGTDGDLGLIYTIMAISEIPTFLYSRVLIKKYKPVNMILFSSIFYILRQVLYLIASSPIQVILIQLLCLER